MNMDYKKLFLAKCMELEFKNVFKERHMNELENGGVGFFLEKNIFEKLFTSSNILAGYFIWREGVNAYNYFMEIYEGWDEDVKGIVEQTKEILEGIDYENL